MSLLQGSAPALRNDDIEQLLRLSADDIGAVGFDIETGMGRLNVSRALEYSRAPWVIVGNSVTGGVPVDSTSVYSALMLGVSGLPEGRYDVRRVGIQAPIAWGALLPTVIGAWGRGTMTRGFAAGDTLLGTGWCEPVNGTVGYGGAVFRTHIYRVWDPLSGADLGYFPATAGQVVLAGAALGQYAAGCPQLEAAAGGRWAPVRTVLQRVSPDSSGVDHIELPGWALLGREVELRVVENADDVTRLESARLLRVTTDEASTIATGADGFHVGEFIAPTSVRSSIHGELGHILDGRACYQTSPGETLWVSRTAQPQGSFAGQGEDGPIIIDDGGKDGEGPAPAPGPSAARHAAHDAEILARSGFEVWNDDSHGADGPAAVRFPQSERACEVFSAVRASRVRLVSRGYHRLWRVGWLLEMQPTCVDSFDVQVAGPDGRGVTLAGTPFELSMNDTLTIRSVGSGWLPSALRSGVVHYLLELRGGYGSSSAAAGSSGSAAAEGARTPWARIQYDVDAGPELVLSLAHPANVSMELFDLQGRRVGATFRLTGLRGGEHRFKVAGLASGTLAIGNTMHFLRLRAGTNETLLKVPVLR